MGFNYHQQKNKQTFGVQGKIIFFVPLFWVILGVIEVFSSSRYASELINHSKYYLVSLHIAWIILAAFVGFIIALVPIKTIQKLSKPIFWLNTLLLLFTFINGKVNGASRWVSIFGFTLQPSEFLKITMPLYLTNVLPKILSHKPKNYSEHIVNQFVPILQHVGLPLVLILLQPDLSTFAILVLEIGILYFLVARDYLALDMLILGVAGGFLFLLATTLVDFRKSRLAVYLNLFKYGKIIDPYGAGNQILNILIAVGSGGLLGKGIGHSSQVGGYLVESTAVTDSIAAVLFEELGFIGGTIIVLSYLFWGIFTIYQIYKKDNSVLAAGLISIVFLFTIQALVHFAVNVSLLPLTGVALPFMSYGGSSTMASFMMLGLLFSFFKHL